MGEGRNIAAHAAWEQRKKERNARRGRQVWDDKNKQWIREKEETVESAGELVNG